MLLDAVHLKISTLIVHDVPKTPLGGGQAAPILSEIDFEPDDELKGYLKAKLAETLGRVAYCAKFDPSTTSPAPNLITDRLTAQTIPLVDMSQQLAHHLNTCQNRQNPAGLLTIIQATQSGQQVVMVIKFEREAGVRMSQIELKGKRTFNVSQIKDLVLSDKTRLFKVGFFTKKTDGHIHAEVSDTQTGFQSDRPMADFYLKQFLGCIYCSDPIMVTQSFYSAAEKFIDSVKDPLLKTKYELALISDLASADATMDPRNFAQRHMDPVDQDMFIAAIRVEGSPTTTFRKDTQAIRNRIQKIQYDFAGGVSVLGSPEAIESTTELQSLQDGRSRLIVTDELRRTKGRR
jgi:hypothetical protein